MDKFSKWTGLAHSVLSKSYPKLKRSQSREFLAAWLGHRTYASLRVKDLDVLHGAAKYVIIDPHAAVNRANDLGFPVTSEQWREVEMTLRPSGVSGDLWLTDMHSMHFAARLTFEDTSHPDIYPIWQPIGMADGRLSTSSACHAAEGSHPEELRFSVHGEVRAFSEHHALAVPVVAHVLFKRVGIRLYALGELLSVVPEGPPHPYEQEKEFENYGMSED
jgi:uncharacterized protein (DUF849 family)